MNEEARNAASDPRGYASKKNRQLDSQIKKGGEKLDRTRSAVENRGIETVRKGSSNADKAATWTGKQAGGAAKEAGRRSGNKYGRKAGDVAGSRIESTSKTTGNTVKAVGEDVAKVPGAVRRGESALDKGINQGKAKTTRRAVNSKVKNTKEKLEKTSNSAFEQAKDRAREDLR